MTRKEIYDFVKRHKLAVLATVSTSNVPEAALVGIAATEQLELIFDTVTSSRKYGNLRTNPNIAFVIGWDDEITLQYEGIAEEIRGKDLPAWKEIYFRTWPDGRERERWPEI